MQRIGSWCGDDGGVNMKYLSAGGTVEKDQSIKYSYFHSKSYYSLLGLLLMTANTTQPNTDTNLICADKKNIYIYTVYQTQLTLLKI